ncbi:TAXI family TRAP transporter solute-binding subunit [Nocardia sp. NPDC127579]|uniref:TAXI family TRAP transporter solute-binding subunit n=1 Tax=Nocardia sp. NPDC127579 TaxID=3345402 RepID=UPI0036439575
MRDGVHDRSPRTAMISRRALFGLAGALMVGACAGSPEAVRLGSARAGGLFHEIAQLLARVAAEADTVRIDPVITAGSEMNLDLLARGELDAALCLADAAHAAHPRVLAIGRLYEAYIYLAVRPDSPIQRIEELRGMRVDLGVAGSGAARTAERLLRTAGLDPVSDLAISNRAVAEAADALYAGAVDAILWGGGVPTPGVDIPARMRLLDVGDLAAPMREKYAFTYDRLVIPANAYPGAPAVSTIGVANLLLVATTIDDAAVAAITELLLRYADRVVPRQALGIHFLDRRWLVDTGTIPVHPAAIEVLRDWHG